MSMALPSNEITPACEEALPGNALRGLEYFNMGHYFEAHEYLEAAWKAERRKIREVYRAVLQVAVGYYHLTRGNYYRRAKNVQPQPKIFRYPAGCLPGDPPGTVTPGYGPGGSRNEPVRAKENWFF